VSDTDVIASVCCAFPKHKDKNLIFLSRPIVEFDFLYKPASELVENYTSLMHLTGGLLNGSRRMDYLFNSFLNGFDKS
jgi:hypothetical protein